jgi:hypothetical protein
MKVAKTVFRICGRWKDICFEKYQKRCQLLTVPLVIYAIL